MAIFNRWILKTYNWGYPGLTMVQMVPTYISQIALLKENRALRARKIKLLHL